MPRPGGRVEVGFGVVVVDDDDDEDGVSLGVVDVLPDEVGLVVVVVVDVAGGGCVVVTVTGAAMA